MSMSMTITSAMDMATAASATIIPSMAPAPEGGMDHDMGGMGMGGPGSCKISVRLSRLASESGITNIKCRCFGTGTPSTRVC